MNWLPGDIAVFNGPRSARCRTKHLHRGETPLLVKVFATIPPAMAGKEDHTICVLVMSDETTGQGNVRPDELAIPPWFETEAEYLVSRHAGSGAP